MVVYEYELKIGWGKSVALPSQALPAPPPGQMAIRSKEVRCTILVFNFYPVLVPHVFFSLEFDGLKNFMLEDNLASCALPYMLGIMTCSQLRFMPGLIVTTITFSIGRVPL